jgi:hypothetical protein
MYCFFVYPPTPLENVEILTCQATPVWSEFDIPETVAHFVIRALRAGMEDLYRT